MERAMEQLNVQLSRLTRSLRRARTVELPEGNDVGLEAWAKTARAGSVNNGAHVMIGVVAPCPWQPHSESNPQPVTRLFTSICDSALTASDTGAGCPAIDAINFKWHCKTHFFGVWQYVGFFNRKRTFYCCLQLNWYRYQRLRICRSVCLTMASVYFLAINT